MELYLTNLCNWSSDQKNIKNFPNLALFYSPDLKKIKPFFNFSLIPFCDSKKIQSWSLNCLLKPKPTPILRLPVPIPVPEQVPEPVPDSDESRILCDQLEKLVFFKNYKEALELFEVSPHSIKIRASTYDCLINACIALSSRRAARMLVQRYLSDSDADSDSNSKSNSNFDVYLHNRFIFMHIKVGLLSDAWTLFAEMPERNVTTFNMLTAGLVKSGKYWEALDMFLLTWKRTSDVGPRMFMTILRACAGLAVEYLGRQFHSIVTKQGYFGNNPFAYCALMGMYAKCGRISAVQKVFDIMPCKTIVGWNTIITGYAFNGYSERALLMYEKMRRENVGMDHFTFATVIRVCTRLGSIGFGRQAHADLVRNGFGLDLVAGTALVDLYCKWARMEDALNVFDRMPRKNVITWNALIGGYGYHGMGHTAVTMFDRMVNEGFLPNHITFLNVLTACAYSGMLEKGRDLFEKMQREYKIKPRAMHYACMVDLLGRAGFLDEALNLIKENPCGPTANMWAALIRACRAHKNTELGLDAAEKLFELEPEKLGNYILLLNMYLKRGRRQDAARVLIALRNKGLKLGPSYSWIEVKRKPCLFILGDKSNPRSEEIYTKLEELRGEIEKVGYVKARKKYLLSDVNEAELRVCEYHSERLAVAFGVISTPDFTPLQIVQGHRICEDCHNVIRLISLVCKREIVLRDASRFHHFREGNCSCGEYW